MVGTNYKSGSKIGVRSIFDKRGNLTEVLQDGTTVQSFVFGALNRLESATSKEGTQADYLYSALGNRVASSTKDELNPTKDIDYVLDLTKQYNNVVQIDDGVHVKDYLWDTGILAEMSADSTSTYLRDDLGSPLQFIGSDGISLESYAYGEFGQDISKNQGTMQPFGYTGYSFDEVADTYFAQARQYDPSSARFISADTHWDSTNMLYGDTNYALPDTNAIKQSGNLYSYVMADPLKHVDRLGMFESEVHIDLTREWAGSVGISPDIAHEIAMGNKSVDFPVNKLPNPILQPREFINSRYWDAIRVDGLNTNPVINPVRVESASDVVRVVLFGSFQFGGSGQAYHFNVQHNNRVVNNLGVASNVDTRLSLAHSYFHQATLNGGCPRTLGRGLHALQDFFAHGNMGRPGMNNNWFTEALSRVGVAGHIGPGSGKFDNARYDWADCSLTSVRRVGTGANNGRLTSTELASKGFIGSWNYETGNR